MEVKILKRGKFYLTPFTLDHIDEVAANLSHENIRELKILGHLDIKQAITEMYECSECYLVRKEGEVFTAVGGLWYNEDQDYPQMFFMFSHKIKENFTSIARGSKMLLNYLEQTQPQMTMTILADYEIMVDWAVWLGFEPVGVSISPPHKYVDFVRCNPNQKSVYDGELRPITH